MPKRVSAGSAQSGQAGGVQSGQAGRSDARLSYFQRQNNTISRLQREAEPYRAFLDSYRDVFGDEYADTMDRALGNLKTIQDSMKAERGYQDLLEGYNQYIGRFQADAQGRDGVWQEPKDFEDYSRQMRGKASSYQTDAVKLRNYYSANRDLYGDETVDRLLNQLDSMGKSFRGSGRDCRRRGSSEGSLRTRRSSTSTSL